MTEKTSDDITTVALLGLGEAGTAISRGLAEHWLSKDATRRLIGVDTAQKDNVRGAAITERAREIGGELDDRYTEALGTAGLVISVVTGTDAKGAAEAAREWLTPGTLYLDVNTLRALEEGLENFAGCAVIISHDRWFLDRVCTHILAFEGDSSVIYFEGGYSDYEENRKKRLGNISPTRIKYRNEKIQVVGKIILVPGLRLSLSKLFNDFIFQTLIPLCFWAISQSVSPFCITYSLCSPFAFCSVFF